MNVRIPLSQLQVSDAQRAAVLRVLDSGWLSMGPETAECEQRWCELTGAGHAALTASCTASLWLALGALDVGPGDEVVLPSLTFVADANVVAARGAIPVLADVVSPDIPLLDPGSVAALATDRTRAVIAVHYAGYRVDIDAVRDAAPGVPVVEDCAHAVGPLDDGTWPGGEGEISCYSFFANKNLGVGEGGMVTTPDPEVAARIRLLRSHGMSSLTWDRHRGHASSYDVLAPGMNFRPSELTAAMVGAGLERLSAENAARRYHLAAYRDGFIGSGARLVFDGDGATTGHLAVVVVDPARRDDVRAHLGELGIQTSVHYPPIHRFSHHRRAYGETTLPRTELAAESYVSLPLWGDLTDRDRDAVVAAVRAVVG